MSRALATAAAVILALFLAVPAFAAWASWVTGQHVQAVFNGLMFVTIAAATCVIWHTRKYLK